MPLMSGDGQFLNLGETVGLGKVKLPNDFGEAIDIHPGDNVGWVYYGHTGDFYIYGAYIVGRGGKLYSGADIFKSFNRVGGGGNDLLEAFTNPMLSKVGYSNGYGSGHTVNAVVSNEFKGIQGIALRLNMDLWPDTGWYYWANYQRPLKQFTCPSPIPRPDFNGPLTVYYL